jgi:Endodeoxyribonuclease RusA
VSVRKRTWASSGGARSEAWVVDFRDADGKRRLKTFKTRADAQRFKALSSAVRSGLVPEPLVAAWSRPTQFTVTIPDGSLRRRAGRGHSELVDALRAACPAAPTPHNIILHVVAEMSPRHVVADVDNLLKPVLDALKGIAWIDDTQICELLVRRTPAQGRRLRIKFWQIPTAAVAPHLNALMDADLISNW